MRKKRTSHQAADMHVVAQNFRGDVEEHARGTVGTSAMEYRRSFAFTLNSALQCIDTDPFLSRANSLARVRNWNLRVQDLTEED